MLEVSTQDLRNLKDTLKKLTSQVDSVLYERSKLLEVLSDSQLGDLKVDSIYNPDLYYKLTFLDKSLCITFDKSYYQDNQKLRAEGQGFYHFQCIGYRSKIYDKFLKFKHDYLFGDFKTKANYFCNFHELDEAIHYFTYFVLDFLFYQNSQLYDSFDDKLFVEEIF